MIKSFRSKETKKLFGDEASRRFSSIQRIARRKLEMLEAAIKLDPEYNEEVYYSLALVNERINNQ